MSLVITSNTPKNDVNTPTQGINLPYSYTNHLQGTLKIPPQSQIAVQSVKFNKTGNIQLNKFNTQFGFFQGRDPDDADWDKDQNLASTNFREDDVCNNSLMIPTYILPKNTASKNFSYNTDEIARELEKAWKKTIYHPNLLENVDTAINPGPKVVALRNASNQGFTGWDFRLHNASDKPGGVAPAENHASLNWINAFWGETAPTYSSPTLTNPDTTDYQAYIGTNLPLSLVNGSMNVSFGTHRSVSGKGFAYAEFGIGLVRACLPTSPDNPEDLPQWYEEEGMYGATGDMGFSSAVSGYHTGRYFWDWVMTSEYDAGESKHAIKLYHNVNITDDRGSNSTTKMEEYDYNDGVYYYLETLEYTNIIFNIQNERVKIVIEKAGYTSTTLVDGADTGGSGGTTNASNMKPVCPTTRFLYPKLLLKPTKNMTVDAYYGVNVANHTYNSANYIDLWSQAKSTGGELLKWSRYLDTSIFSNYDADVVNYKILNRQVGLETLGDGERIPGNFRIVSAPANECVMSKSLNTDLILGFSGNTMTPAETSYATASPDIVKWTSNGTPELTSKESIFVRLKNMTFESANFSKSALSKILYHIPTFDNSGNDVGALHLEPNEMVYLDLNNPNEVQVSTMEVDLVYNDETLATGVEGKTVVVFHIRPRI